MAVLVITLGCGERDSAVAPENPTIAAKLTISSTRVGGHRVIPTTSFKATDPCGDMSFKLADDGPLTLEKLELANVDQLAMIPIHLARPGKNGPVAVGLFPTLGEAGPLSVEDALSVTETQNVSSGTITDDMIGTADGFDGTVAALVDQLRRGTAYSLLYE